MPLIYVTGISTSGKSTVLEELRAKGFAAYGVDEDSYGRWINHQTGEEDLFPRDQPDLDKHTWYRDHEWALHIENVAELKERSDRGNVVVFLCGVAAGEREAWQYFDVVCALVLDEPTIRRRIDTRKDAFSKRSEEVARILEWNVGYEDRYRGFGAVIIDATQPLPAVVGAVLTAARL